LIEIIMIIVVIIVIGNILLFLLRRMGHPDKPRYSTCTSNQRQIVASLQMYAQDHNDLLPLTTSI